MSLDVIIYTDGGADPNPGPGGWGAVLIHPVTGKTRELSGGDGETTNNRMELTAAIEALDALKKPCQVELHTDSQYLRKGITQWLPGWIAKNWKRQGGPVKNVDLWKRLAVANERHTVDWRWVKGHAGHVHNERADALATAEIRKRLRAAGDAPPPPPVDAEIYLKVSAAGRRGAWAALLRHGGQERTLSEAVSGVTANQMDIVAATRALEALPRGASAAIFASSDYLRNGATQWVHGWRRRGWKTATGDPVKNASEWRALTTLLENRRVLWPSTKGQKVPEFKLLGKVAKEALEG